MSDCSHSRQRSACSSTTLTADSRSCQLFLVNAIGEASVSALGHFRADLLQRAGGERRQDAVLDAPERIADAALRVLAAVLGFGRAGGHRQRPVDRLDDVGDRDDRRGARPGGSRRACPGATSAARGAPAAAAPWPSARSGMSYCSAISRALADADVRAHREVLHRHQRVVGFLGEAQHTLASPQLRCSLPGRRRGHHKPNCSFAASDIRSFVHPAPTRRRPSRR